MAPVIVEPSLLNSLYTLLDTGFTPDPDGELAPLLRGVAHPVSEAETGWVISSVLLERLTVTANKNEAACTLLALLPEIRESWLAIAAARCKEAGSMNDCAILTGLVSALGGVSGWVEASLSKAALSATPFAATERECTGVSFEQTAALPILMRILAAAYSLSQVQSTLLTPLVPVDQSGMDANRNWVPGRMIALPGTASDTTFLLHGKYEPAEEQPVMTWVCSSPWALLLAMVVYVQDTWKAEARGGLILELQAGQNGYAPGEVGIIVQGTEGDEVRCGTLAQLLLNVLASLNVNCFPYTPEPSVLNTLISQILSLLITRRVWDFKDSTGMQNGHYQIHPVFADSCYRLPGSKVFNRTGRQLRQAVRLCAEKLYTEKRPLPNSNRQETRESQL